MSKHIGFLVVNQRTGFMLEGRDHAAKIFDSQPAARRAIRHMQPEVPAPITYENLALSLLKGASFCFDTEAGHEKFLKEVRNDPGNKPFLAFSRDRTFILWRHSNEKPSTKTDPGAGVAPDSGAPAAPAKDPSLEAGAFNTNILVR